MYVPERNIRIVEIKHENCAEENNAYVGGAEGSSHDDRPSLPGPAC